MNVYSSPYSTIDINKETSLLVGAWLEASAKLNEEGVKKEISKIIDFVRIYKIKKILVDVREYPFRENESIQRWINYEYIPLIIDKGAERYALVVKEMVISNFEHMEDMVDETDVMKLKYFTDTQSALQWLKS